ncbi:larval cuticle protein A2B-like [Panulirus ornatus]|uniref:larval cuticle protein A2B-like n=1 Tax=Panulirus ornatus TaxID=150431 RepID=UPI003A87D1DE
MMCKVALAAVLVTVVVGLPHPEGPPVYTPPSYSAPHAPSPSYKEDPKPYAFDYGVKDDYSGANFGHNENSDGQAVKGSYKVALPDGRTQIVNYVADHYNGFQAEVSYEGQAVYPDTKPTYQAAPVYNPPAPSPYA